MFNEDGPRGSYSRIRLFLDTGSAIVADVVDVVVDDEAAGIDDDEAGIVDVTIGFVVDVVVSAANVDVANAANASAVMNVFMLFLLRHHRCVARLFRKQYFQNSKLRGHLSVSSQGITS